MAHTSPPPNHHAQAFQPAGWRIRLRRLAVCDSVGTYSPARWRVHPLRQVLEAQVIPQRIISKFQSLRDRRLHKTEVCTSPERRTVRKVLTVPTGWLESQALQK